MPVLARHSRAAGAGVPSSAGLSLGWVRLQQLWTPHPCSTQVLRELGSVAPVVFVPFLQLQMLLLRRGTALLLGDGGGVGLASVPGPVCWCADYIRRTWALATGSISSWTHSPLPSDTIRRQPVVPPHMAWPPPGMGLPSTLSPLAVEPIYLQPQTVAFLPPGFGVALTHLASSLLAARSQACHKIDPCKVYGSPVHGLSIHHHCVVPEPCSSPEITR